MARYTDAVCKLCRRESIKLFLKGERCLSPKCAVERRKGLPPGMDPKKMAARRKMSDFGMQLREKQKARRIYGVMERQFRRYFAEASRRKGMTGVILLTTLERRLDNVVYRLGLADSRSQARQLVLHGHFEVNGHKANIPSLLVNAGDNVSVREPSKSSTYFKDRLQVHSAGTIPTWLSMNLNTMNGSVVSEPSREDVTGVDLNEQLIVEFYSR